MPAFQREQAKSVYSRLTACFQPQRQLDGTIYGLETLARVSGAHGCLLLPNVFIHKFEDAAGELLLAKTMIWHAFAMAIELKRLVPQARVAVNVTPALAARTDFHTWLVDLLDSGSIGPWLTLEILEASYGECPVRLIDHLHALRDRDVRISVDDFGTGHSTWSRVNDLPVDEWKLARPLVAGVARNARRAIALQSLLNAGERLGLRTVLEGVEAQEDVEWIQSNGPTDTVVQGRAIAVPMRAHTARTWLHRRSLH